LKRWLRWVSKGPILDEKFKDEHTFLTEMANSHFNLITDSKIKIRISKYLIGMPEDALPEILLKSYLYLMIGNITHSDNLMKKFIQNPPALNWEKSTGDGILAHRVWKEVAQQIILKLSHHPADRKIFHLLVLYLKNYYNEESVLKLIEDVDTSELESKLSLRTIEVIAPDLVHSIRLVSIKDDRRLQFLSPDQFQFNAQAYWVWPFFEINPFPSFDIFPVLNDLRKQDELWYIYLSSDEQIREKLAKQSYSTFLPGHRAFLKSKLSERKYFMMALFKLIEMGDISSEIIGKTVEYIVSK
jgi:hypothetical protein